MLTKSLHTVTATVRVAKYMHSSGAPSGSFAVLAADRADSVGDSRDRDARQLVRRALSILGYEPMSYGWDDPTVARIFELVRGFI